MSRTVGIFLSKNTKEIPCMPSKEKTHYQTQKELHESQWKLIQYLQEIGWGSVEINIQNGLPVYIKSTVRTRRVL